MAAQPATSWHFLGEQTTLYPHSWLCEQVDWKVRVLSPGSISGKHSARYLVWGVSYLQHNLLTVGSGWRWYQEECWAPFAWDRSFLVPCREPFITIALFCFVLFFTCNSTSLPTAKWLMKTWTKSNLSNRLVSTLWDPQHESNKKSHVHHESQRQ